MHQFKVSGKALKDIDEMMPTFGVSDRASLIRKALALANVAAENMDENHVVTILSPNREAIRILMAG